ncbi:hypothetical protein CAOG_03812 [Capsaspora owczarzaki ATCC 30864]|uniref:Uncharacterized protein n=1 Tax=Capsaspora owczarzaki (strain ATCC 30864) TaxID=595528 RepID=A0A0D2WNU5_CAPO3|nr:hypothetical protein CAOG_03812 [Capsaspora owczarzaki ATCC 30864]KJE92930.1 hypothetical protein CAOG_003812 [Capsaspora owczarzaki ATCC 30864]|eukprot:XP_004363540.1 hypothetical protein CAOG_03812 [Capsaspora owczarzaki ATCC 30864]
MQAAFSSSFPTTIAPTLGLPRRLALRELGLLHPSRSSSSRGQAGVGLQQAGFLASVLAPRSLPAWYVSDVAEHAIPLNDTLERAFAPMECNFGPGSKSGTLAVADEAGWVSLIKSNQTQTSDWENGRAFWSAHTEVISDISWNEHGDGLLTASADHTIRLWDLERLNYNLFRGHALTVKTARFVPNSSSVFLSSSRDGAVMMWDVRMRPVGDSRPPTNQICPAHWSPDSKRKSGTTAAMMLFDARTILSAGCDGSVRIWDARKAYSAFKGHPIPVATIVPTGQGITSLDIDASGTRVLARSSDGRISTFLPSHPDQPAVQYCAQSLRKISTSYFVNAKFSPDGQHILSGSHEGNAYIWRVDAPDRQPWVLQTNSTTFCAAWANNLESTIATGSVPGMVRFWHLDRHRAEATVEGIDTSRQFLVSRDLATAVLSEDDLRASPMEEWDLSASLSPAGSPAFVPSASPLSAMVQESTAAFSSSEPSGLASEALSSELLAQEWAANPASSLPPASSSPERFARTATVTSHISMHSSWTSSDEDDSGSENPLRADFDDYMSVLTSPGMLSDAPRSDGAPSPLQEPSGDLLLPNGRLRTQRKLFSSRRSLTAPSLPAGDGSGAVLPPIADTLSTESAAALSTASPAASPASRAAASPIALRRYSSSPSSPLSARRRSASPSAGVGAKRKLSTSRRQDSAQLGAAARASGDQDIATYFRKSQSEPAPATTQQQQPPA